MARLHSGRLRACVALALSAFGGACDQPADSVVFVEYIDAGAMMPAAAGSGSAPQNATPCMLSPTFPILDALVKNDCKFKARDSTVALIVQFANNVEPVMGESRRQYACEIEGLVIYPDPEDQGTLVVCEAACDSIRARVKRETDAYIACGLAMTAMDAGAPK